MGARSNDMRGDGGPDRGVPLLAVLPADNLGICSYSGAASGMHSGGFVAGATCTLS